MNGSETDWEAVVNYWIDQEVGEACIPEGGLIAEIEEFLDRYKTCALATTGVGIVRNTTVEYVHAEGAPWVISEGSLRFRTLRTNNNVCLIIHDKDTSFGMLAGSQVTGIAGVLEPFSAGYERACLLHGIPMERLWKLSFAMSTIKVVPTRYDHMNDRFRERGFSAHQHVNL